MSRGPVQGEAKWAESGSLCSRNVEPVAVTVPEHGQGQYARPFGRPREGTGPVPAACHPVRAMPHFPTRQSRQAIGWETGQLPCRAILATEAGLESCFRAASIGVFEVFAREPVASHAKD